MLNINFSLKANTRPRPESHTHGWPTEIKCSNTETYVYDVLYSETMYTKKKT